MLWQQTVEYASLSDIGFRRKNNQDCCTVLIAANEESWRRRGHFFMVADGMGGHAVGELASKIAVDTVPHSFQKIKDLAADEALRRAIIDANHAIHERGEQNRDFHDMGTTCTTLVLLPEGAVVGHVGDSRLYRIRGERIEQLTFDHSLQWELLRQGIRRREDILLHEPRNVITRCLGPEPAVEVDIEGPLPVLPGDVYLLCSDGLTGLVSDEEIGMIGRTLAPADACRLLVNLANLRGGTDNITVIIARVGGIPQGLTDVDGVRDDDGRNWQAWGWLIGNWALAILFVAAVSLLLFGKPVEGVLILGVLAFCASGMLLTWIKLNQGLRPRRTDRSHHWQPYRTASARLNPRFLSQLASLEHVLHQTAAEEGWSIDWAEHKTAYERAKNSLQSRSYVTALQELGNAIQVLMSGIQQQRKRITHAARWGKPASSESKAETSAE